MTLDEIITRAQEAVRRSILAGGDERLEPYWSTYLRVSVDVRKISSSVTRVEWKGKHARALWKAMRRHFLTGTDWPAVLGLDPNRSPWSVWAEKVKDPTPEELAAEAKREEAFAAGAIGGLEEAMRWGNLLEDPVAREVALRLRRRFVDHGRYTLFVNEDLPVPCAASIDREIEGKIDAPCPHEHERFDVPCSGCKSFAGLAKELYPVLRESGVDGVRRVLIEKKLAPDETLEHLDLMFAATLPAFIDKIGAGNFTGCLLCRMTGEVHVPDPRGPGVYEGKTVGAFADPEGEWSEAGGGPVKHQVQLQGGLAVMQYRWGVLAGLNGSPAFNLRIHEHERDDALIAWALERFERFWPYVTSRTPPPADGSEATAKALARYYDRDNGATIELPPVAAVYARELAIAKREEKIAEERKREAKNALAALLGPHSAGTIDGMDGGLTWKRVDPKPTCCKSCSAVVQERKPHRRMLAFGAAKFSELFDEAKGKEGHED